MDEITLKSLGQPQLPLHLHGEKDESYKYKVWQSFWTTMIPFL